MFELGNLILVLVTYSQTYPQKLWIENRVFLQQSGDRDTLHARIEHRYEIN